MGRKRRIELVAQALALVYPGGKQVDNLHKVRGQIQYLALNHHIQTVDRLASRVQAIYQTLQLTELLGLKRPDIHTRFLLYRQPPSSTGAPI